MAFTYPAVFSDSDSYDTAYGKILKNIGFFKWSVCKNLPTKITANDVNCKRCFTFKKFSKGSVVMEGQVGAADYADSSSLLSDLNSANLIPGGTSIVSSIVASGFSSSDSSSSTNIGLIIGVAVPLGILCTYLFI